MFFRYTIFSILAYSCAAIAVAPLDNISPDAIEFAYDGHDTLIKRNTFEMASILAKKAPLKLSKIATLYTYEYIRYYLTNSIGPTLKLLWDIRALLKREPGATGQEYKTIIDAYDKTLWTIAQEMAAAYDPIAGMQELLEELHQRGYTQRIATNMSAQDYENLVKKHPQLFKYLDGGLTVDATQQPIIRKPLPEYFEHYDHSYNADHAKKIIFIDDNILNVNAAQAHGMIGILFKSTEQLRRDLKALGIAIK